MWQLSCLLVKLAVKTTRPPFHLLKMTNKAAGAWRINEGIQNSDWFPIQSASKGQARRRRPKSSENSKNPKPNPKNSNPNNSIFHFMATLIGPLALYYTYQSNLPSTDFITFQKFLSKFFQLDKLIDWSFWIKICSSYNEEHEQQQQQ